VARVHVDDFPAGTGVRQVDFDGPEPARPQQGVVDEVDAVGGTNDQYWYLGPEPVQFGEQLGDDGVAGPVAAVVAACARSRDRVELVEHHDGRGVAPGLREQLADLAFALADVHVGYLRPADHQNGGVEPGGDRLREQRLPGPGRAVEDESSRDEVVAQVLGQVRGTADDVEGT
jgi:hypothetical protein